MTHKEKRVSSRTRLKKSLIRLNNGVKNRALALVYLSSRNRLRILPVLPTCVGSSTRQLQAMKHALIIIFAVLSILTGFALSSR